MDITFMEEVENVNKSQFSTIQHQQQIIKCYNYLLQTLSNNSFDVAQAQQLLLTMSKQPQFIKIIMSILLIPGISSDNSKLIATYIKTYIKNILSNDNISLGINVVEQIINFISNNKLELKLKELLVSPISLIFEKDKSGVLLQSCQQKFMSILQQSSSIANSSQINYELICILLHLILQSLPSFILDSFLFLSQTFPNLIQLSLITIELLEKAIQVNENFLSQVLYYLFILLSSVVIYVKKLGLINQIQNYNNNVSILRLIDNPTMIKLLNKCLNINLNGNKLQFPIFYEPTSMECKYVQKVTQNFHSLKLTSIQIIKQQTKILISNDNCNSYTESSLLKQSPTYITLLVKSISQLLQTKNYYNLSNQIQPSILQQIYKYLIQTLKINTYYELYLKLKVQLFNSCLFKTLLFTPSDYHNFLVQPQEFVNSIYQIFDVCQTRKKKFRKVENVPYSYGKGKRYHDSNKMSESVQNIPSCENINKSQQQNISTENNQPLGNCQEQEIQLFDNLKTNSAKLLIKIIQHIDGTLRQIVMLCLMTFSCNNQQQIIHKKDMMWLILSIIKDQITDFNLLNNIRYVLGYALISTELPVKLQSQNIQPNPLIIEFSMTLVTVDRYIRLVQQSNDNFLETLFLIIQQLMVNSSLEVVPKILGTQIIMSIFSKMDPQQNNSHKILWLMSTTLELHIINSKSLDCILMIIQQQSQRIKDDLRPIVEILGKIVNLLLQSHRYLQSNQHIITQLWNIIEQIFQNNDFISQTQHCFYVSLHQLLQSLKNNDDQTFEQHIYQIIINRIKIKSSITKFDLQVIDIAKNHFYQRMVKYSLKSKFQVLQYIIYYGVDELIENINYIKDILEMCIYSIQQTKSNERERAESQCCEGLFLMQSLMISVGKSFDKQMWSASLKCLYKKIKETVIKYDFLKGNLITNITLILVLAHSFFAKEEIQELLSIVLNEHHCFSFQDSGKIYTILIIKLLGFVEIPFVHQHYLQILDSATSMLKMKIMDKVNLIHNLDMSEAVYLQLDSQTLHSIKLMDEFEFFNKTITMIKNSNKKFFEQFFSTLPQDKKQFLIEIMNVRKVKNNLRTIYKFKKKQ